jgi:uncharacterized protein YodC (DUF2158 family)
MNLLCAIGLHLERFLSTDVAGGSSCPCGKKSTPAIVWPEPPPPKEYKQEIYRGLEPGTIVKLRIDGPKMITTGNCRIKGCVFQYQCQWFDNTDLKEGYFTIEVLKIINHEDGIVKE